NRLSADRAILSGNLVRSRRRGGCGGVTTFSRLLRGGFDRCCRLRRCWSDGDLLRRGFSQGWFGVFGPFGSGRACARLGPGGFGFLCALGGACGRLLRGRHGNSLSGRIAAVQNVWNAEEFL